MPKLSLMTNNVYMTNSSSTPLFCIFIELFVEVVEQFVAYVTAP